jgi:hypothetical protein
VGLLEEKLTQKILITAAQRAFKEAAVRFEPFVIGIINFLK